MKILYVDNNEVFAGVVINGFLQGHDVTVANTTAGARRHLREGQFDVILIENDLAGGKGCELICDLRSRRQDITIVGVSGRDEDNQMLLKAGANDVCSKMDLDRIAGILEELI